MMGNEQSAAAHEREEAKMEPSSPSSAAGPKGRERGQSDESRSRSASPQKKRHQKEDHATGAQQVKQHPPEPRPVGGGGVGGGDKEEEEREDDEWLQGSAAALGTQGGSKGKGGGGGKKKGKKGAKATKGAGGSPPEKEQLSPTGREQSNDAPPSTPPKAVPAALVRGKCVQWGGVVVQTFQRKPSQDSVPASGAWPLGLGEADGEGAVEAVSVDAFEAARAEEIERRISELPKRLRKVATGETRQFDYKASGDRNPIFGPLREQERKQLLVKALMHAAEAEALQAGGSSPGGMASSHHRQAVLLEEQEQARCQELDDLRASRKRIGCSCHQTKAPEKLSLKRLKEELHRRHLSAPGTDKAKLIEMLKQALAAERLCSDSGPDACECFAAGVPCHADVCGCCAHKKCVGGAHHHLGCSNPVGTSVYKEGTVHGYRGRFVSARSVDGRPRSCSI